MQREIRIRHDEREARGPESVPALSVHVLASAEHEETIAAEETVSPAKVHIFDDKTFVEEQRYSCTQRGNLAVCPIICLHAITVFHFNLSRWTTFSNHASLAHASRVSAEFDRCDANECCSCRCPSYFTPRMTPDGVCQCNCHENNDNCVKTRRGKVYFSLADRM